MKKVTIKKGKSLKTKKKSKRGGISPEFFSALLKNAFDFTAVLDAEGRITFHTATVRGFLGYRENELKGYTIFDLIHPDDISEIRRAFSELVEVPGRVVTREFRFRHKNGTYRWIESTGLNLLNDPMVKGIVTNSRDVDDWRRTAELLRESEERYRMLAEASQDMIFIIDRNDRVVYANRCAAKWFEGKPENIIGKNRAELFPQDVSKRQRKSLETVWTSGEPLYMEDDIRFKDKEAFIGTWLVPLKNERGEVQSVMGVSRDITDRKNAEEKLKRSEALFRGLIENTQEIFTIINEKGEMTYLSPSIKRIMGFNIEELSSRNAFDFVHPEDTWILADAIKEVLEKPAKVVTIEIRMRHKDGSYRYIESTGYNLLHDPAIGGIIVNSRDITERKQLEQALRESMERFRLIFKHSPVGIFHYDTDLKITEFNDRFVNILQSNEERLKGLDMKTLKDKSVLPALLKPLTGGNGFYEGFYSATTSNAKLWISMQTAPLRDISGRVVGGIGIVEDVTEKKLLEQQLFQSKKLEAVGRLAGGIAHDFNNLLTLIMLHSEVILKELEEKGNVSASIKEIYDSAQRASNLTTQLLSFARRQVIEPAVFNINTLIKGINKMLKSLMTEKIHIETILDENIYMVKVDPAQLEHAIINLAINAKDAMPEGGRLIIETQNVFLDENYAKNHPEVVPGRYVLIAVSDTGVGMDEEIKSKIFEPFFTTKKEGTGTGLGLASVYGFIKQSGGHIWVYSEIGKGTTFKIYLPAYMEGRGETKVTKEEPEKLQGTETILLAEDEPSILDLVTKILTSSGYRVITARDGIDALEKAEKFEGRIDLLLTDLIMPKLGGKELYERLKKIRPETKALFTSGYTDNVIIHNFIIEEGVNFLQKPFRPEVLLKKIRQVLEGR